MVRSNYLKLRNKPPKQKRSQELVATIFEACVRIFKSRPAPDFTTRAVAEVAGVSVGSLYQYFPSKESLIAALIEREVVKQVEILRNEYSECKQLSLEHACQRILSRLFQHIEENRTLLRGVMPFVFSVGGLEDVVRSRKIAADFLRQIFTERGTFDSSERAIRAAQFIVAAVSGVIETRVFDESGQISADIAARELAVMISGYVECKLQI